MLALTVAVAGASYSAWQYAHRLPDVTLTPEPKRVEPPRSLEPVPPELRELVKTITLPFSENHRELPSESDPLERAPNILINHEAIFLDGERLDTWSLVNKPDPLFWNDKGGATTIGGRSAPSRVFDRLVAKGDAWKLRHPGEALRGVVHLWIDTRTSALVVKRVLEACAIAGFPKAFFVTRARDNSWHLVRLDADWRFVRVDPFFKPPTPRGMRPSSHFATYFHDPMFNNLDSLQACYEQASAPAPKGTVEVRFDIQPDGSVARARLAEGTTLSDRGVQLCVLETFRKFVFPRPGSDTVNVVYPVKFGPKL